MHRTSRRGIGLLVAAICLLLMPGTAVAGNATGINITVPNSKPAISGKITRHGGGAVKNAVVSLVDPAFGYPSDYAFTDSAGKFTFYDKTNSSFLISVDPHGGAPTYAPGYYRQADPDHFTTTQSSATEVHYAGTLISGINIAVRPGHAIKGHVHRQKNNAPLKGVRVLAAAQSGGTQGCFFSLGGATTDASGNYTIPGLANGPYQLTFCPKSGTNILAGCYRNAPQNNYTADCSGSASNITVNNVDVVNKNVSLPDGHLITGKVHDAQGHNLCALVSATSTDTFTTVSYTTACGAFTLIAVPTGNYRIGVGRSGASRFVSGSYANNPHHWSESASTAVHVGNANVNLATIQPDPGHTISGTIMNAANQGVSGVAVTLQGSGGSYQFITTGTNGNFAFVGVGAGTHTISESASSSGQNLRRGYYRSGAPPNWTADENQATALSANANHTSLVIKPAKGFSIAGRITNSSHVGVTSIMSAAGSTYGFALTDSQGNYVMTGLDPGNYTVQVSPGSTATTHYRSGYYNKTAAGHFVVSYTNATSIHVGP